MSTHSMFAHNSKRAAEIIKISSTCQTEKKQHK